MGEKNISKFIDEIWAATPEVNRTWLSMVDTIMEIVESGEFSALVAEGVEEEYITL